MRDHLPPNRPLYKGATAEARNHVVLTVRERRSERRHIPSIPRSQAVCSNARQVTEEPSATAAVCTQQSTQGFNQKQHRLTKSRNLAFAPPPQAPKDAPAKTKIKLAQGIGLGGRANLA